MVLISFFQTVFTTSFLFFMVICGYISNIKKKLILKDFYEVLELILPGTHISIVGKPHEMVKWHVEKYGYVVEEFAVKTEDGFVLHLERLSKNCKRSRGQPILLQHGLFQSSGIFVVSNQKKSLAFYLVDLGYDVWLGNNRGVYDKHVDFTPNDDAYWDWSLDELGRYDFNAMVKFIVDKTKRKIVYCGHSQGNAQAFVGLAINPELANDIEMFIALAPAYFVNEFNHWSLKLLQKLPERGFWMLFGNRAFIPIMNYCQQLMHHRVFSSFAYTMFAYLFGWTSDKWECGKKPVIFQTTPRPISTKLIHHWLRVSKLGKLSGYCPSDSLEYQLSKITCPVAVFWGKSDSLVDGEKLVNELREGGVNLIYENGIHDYEHMDIIWARDAVETVFSPLAKLLADRGLNPT